VPDRNQALTRTRCPACSTVFRVTSDQLRAKAGKVRCGYCQMVFNAFDELVDETAPVEAIKPVGGPTPDPGAVDSEFQLLVEQIEALEIVASDEEISIFEPEQEVDASQAAVTPNLEHEVGADDRGEPAYEYIPDVEPEQARPDSGMNGHEGIGQFEPSTAPEAGESESDPLETPEETTQAARDAGLVAARELSETPAFDRWKAGALSGDGAGGFDSEDRRRANWLYVVVALLLIVALGSQLAYHFRGELVRRVPATSAFFEALNVPLPLPAHSELISIETSDLRFDKARDLFFLDASLRNRAAYDQAWPALELTLLDNSEAPVARRVMLAADYLEPGSDLDSFPAGAEVPVRLWIDAKDLGASGYRLYIFYS